MGIGERSVLLRVRRGGEEEHLGLDVLRPELAAGDLRCVAPELRGLGGCEVADYDPLRRAEALSVKGSVHRPDGGVLAHDEVPLDLSIGHVCHGHHVRVVSREGGEVVVTEGVFLSGRVTPPRLQQGDQVLGHLRPPAGLGRVVLDVLGEGHVGPCPRHGEITREHVVERGDVGRALNRGMAAKRQDAPTGPADVPEQELDDRRRPDVLDAH